MTPDENDRHRRAQAARHEDRPENIVDQADRDHVGGQRRAPVVSIDVQLQMIINIGRIAGPI